MKLWFSFSGKILIIISVYNGKNQPTDILTYYVIS